MAQSKCEVIRHRGWEVVRLSSESLQVDIVPSKGMDILSAKWLPKDLDVLWKSPWGLRHRKGPPPSGDSAVNFLAHYPGGWQTIFPNGGDAATVDGVELGFHGEASLVPWDWELIDQGLVATTRLHLSPFELQKKVVVDDNRLTVTEVATNVGGSPQEVMWSHHPAFGAPFISSETRIETEAATFIADDVRDVSAGDLEPGATSLWPSARSRDGSSVDLSVLPGEQDRLDRFGYLTDFAATRALVTNPTIPLTVEMTWDEQTFPHAWYWLEAHATQTYPWFGEAYVLALEPASSYPGQGIEAVRRKTGNLLRFEPRETKSTWVTLTFVTESPA